MRLEEVIADVSIGLISGYVGTKVMEPVGMKLYELESEEDRRQEDQVRPGPPFQIAAQKTTQLLGVRLTEQRLETAGLLFHYGLGMGWGPVYMFLRRATGLPALPAGLLAGAAMSLLIDEWMTPSLGFSAPNSAYPAATHVRGFVAHLVFGLGVAGTAEIVCWLGCSSGRRR